MSPFAAKIDRFVRWFFNVSPMTTSIEPQPEPPRRRAASSSASRRVRSASPKDRRDARAGERREARPSQPASRASTGDKA